MTLMTCPDEGTLRAFLDRADDDHETLAAHVRGCLDCRRTVRTLRLNADTVSGALALLDDDVAAPAVVGLVDRSSEAIDPPVRKRRWGRLATGAAAVALTVGLVITPAGQAVAGGFLSLFHSRSVTAVTLTSSDASQVAGVMSQLGVTAGTPSSDYTTLGSVAEAQGKVVFQIAAPRTSDLPSGLAVTPSVLYLPKSSMTVTFDAAKTAAYLQSTGSSIRVPAGLDGEKLVLHFPDAVALTYSGSGDKQLMVVSAGAFEASTEGPLDVAALRDFLVNVPGVPTSLTKQLGSVDLTSGVLPVPIPVDEVSGTKTTVNGHDAILVVSSGLGAGVVWQSNNRITGVIGSYPSDAVLKVAKGLNG
jgi:hypothetical protein